MTYRVRHDSETRSYIDLSETNADVYSRHPTTDVMCWCFQVPHATAEVAYWSPLLPAIPDDTVLAALRRVAEDPDALHDAWNVSFEYSIWHNVMVPKYGMPPIPLERWRCTMARAQTHGFPRALGQSAKAMRLNEQKDGEGHKLMMQMTRRHVATKRLPERWKEDEDSVRRLIAYCQQDVRTEAAASDHLPPWTEHEERRWLAFWRMNNRGQYTDHTAAALLKAAADDGVTERLHAVRTAVEAATDWMTADEIAEAIRGNPNRLRKYVNDRGVPCLAFDKEGVADLLKLDTLPADVREVCLARQELGKSSVAKFQTLLNTRAPDGRMRFGFNWSAALQTNRLGGADLQPQNLPRGSVDKSVIKAVFADLDYGKLDAFRNAAVWCDGSLKLASSCIRGCMTAAPGHKLVVADWAAIEARLVFWLGDCVTGLTWLRDFDEELNPKLKKDLDIYRRVAAMYLRKSVSEVTKDDRQLGKAIVLGCGYGMGAAKFVETAASPQYGVFLTLEQAQSVVNFYRRTFHEIPKMWYATGDAAIDAVQHPGVVFRPCTKIAYRFDGTHLRCRLPSGKVMWYPYARVGEVWNPRFERMQPELTYETLDSMTKQWGPERTYGGKLVENFTQACGRELMADAMVRADERGVPVGMSIHDELVVENRTEDPYDHKNLEALMCELPAWAVGLPIAAEGWTGRRYSK